MPLINKSISLVSGNLAAEITESLQKIFELIDFSVRSLAHENNLRQSRVRLLRNCNLCVAVNNDSVFVALSNIQGGEIPSEHYTDWSEVTADFQSFLAQANDEFMWENVFGFTFPKQFLNKSDVEKELAAHQIADTYIKDEILYLERLNRIVRINPIFQGRDFLINEKLIFVLSPFKEPFNTIFSDHIKPTVEKTAGITCIRADNIYDNRPIIEDIWRSINEAYIVIAELTERNPNVFYETGIAHTVGKEVILITQNIDDVPFDLRHLRCIVYEYTPRGVQILESNLQNTIDGIRNRSQQVDK